MNKPATKDTTQPEASSLPDPAEVAKTYAQVAERASKLLGDHVQRQLKRGITPPADELGIAQAFMDMTSHLLSNPYKLAQAQMGLVWDYYTLWQQSMLKFMGVDAAPVVTPVKGDNRFREGEAIALQVRPQAPAAPGATPVPRATRIPAQPVPWPTSSSTRSPLRR